MFKIVKTGSCILFALLCRVPPFAATLEDWVTDPNNPLCYGHYIETLPPFPGQSLEWLAKQPSTITSDAAQFLDKGPMLFSGHVHAISGNRQLFADEAEVLRNDENQKISVIHAKDHVKILEPGLRLEGKKADFFIQEDKKSIEQANFRLYERHARGVADSIEVQGSQKMILKNVSYTTCNPFQDTWYLKAHKVTLNKETGRGRAQHAKLYFKNVPVFYAPYLDFPIDDRRQTGFLYPSFGTSNTSGFEFAAPVYWNVAPNYDATFTPRYLSKRGEELQTEFRYLTQESKGHLYFFALPEDRAYRKFKAENVNNHFLFQNNDPRVAALQHQSNNRFLIALKHHSTFSLNWQANIEYNKVSDDNYFVDLSNLLGNASNNFLLRQADLIYQDMYWTSTVRMQHYQTLHPFFGAVTVDPYERLPQVTFKNTNPNLPYGLVWEMPGEFSHFNHKPDFFTEAPFTTGNRYQVRPGLVLPIVTPGWYLKPRIQLDILAYQLHLSPNSTTLKQRRRASRSIPMYDIDSGLMFERHFAFNQTSYLQTLEPRLYYLYVPYRTQNRYPNFDSTAFGFDFNQLFRDNRFAGLDRLGDTQQVTLGLTSRVLEPRTGEERLWGTIGQIFYFNDRKVTVCNLLFDANCYNAEIAGKNRRRSAVASRGGWQVHAGWTATAGVEWDPNKNQIDKNTVYLQYHPSELNVLNAGYQFLRKDLGRIDPKTGVPERLEQTDVSGSWVFSPNWRILGRWYYDLKRHETYSVLAGIEQQGCCTALRFTVQKLLLPNDGIRKYSTGFFVQFIFKGFAGVGNNSLTPMLQENIPGYAWRGTDF